MQDRVRNEFLGQLGPILDLYKDLVRRAPHDDLSGIPESEHYKLVALSRAAIRRIAGASSEYMKQVEEIMEDKQHAWIGPRLTAIVGVVESLQADLNAGYLRTLAELLHAEIFSDFVEMANYLLAEGYKDAAAIIAGAALEAHLRRLAESKGIDLDIAGRPKKADQLNAELAKSELLSKLDQKSVTAWLDLRNKAAHGKFSEYSQEQVSLLLAGLRDFMARIPA